MIHRKTTDPKAVLLLLAVCAAMCTCSLRGLAESPRGTLAVLEAFPAHVTDRNEPNRKARLEAIARAVDAATDDPTERAALLTLGRYESGWARFVMEGRCSEGPRGARECDSGKSFGAFQLRPNAKFPEVPADLEGQATMALRMWRGARVYCRSSVRDELAGAFSQYGSGNSCGHAWAEARAAHLRRIAGRL